MRLDLAGWVGHPVTLSLAALATTLLLLTLEMLLHGLAQTGNVRFQGLLDDHQRLFPFARDKALPLSRVLDLLRWLEIACVGLLWLLALVFPGLETGAAVACAVGVPLVTILAGRIIVPRIGDEEGMAFLLRLARPLVAPLLSLSLTLAPHVEPGDGEDEEESEEEEEVSERELRAFLAVGEAAGIFEADEAEVLESLVEFFDTTVREIMTPRTDMVAVPETTSFAELVEVFATSRKSRVPVFRETIDHIIGAVNVKVVVEHLVRGEQPEVATLVRELLVVPESRKLGELLRDLQRQAQQLAIVVDEYGGTSGLVTVEDVVEEIVGEIQDEHDLDEPPDWEQLGPGLFRLQGRASLEVIEELFDVEVDEEDVDTVGGLVFARHGTVPEAGTVVVDPGLGLRFTVEEMQERRVGSVTAERLQPSSTAEASGG